MGIQFWNTVQNETETDSSLSFCAKGITNAEKRIPDLQTFIQLFSYQLQQSREMSLHKADVFSNSKGNENGAFYKHLQGTDK